MASGRALRFAILIATQALGAAASAETVDVALVLAADVSRSIDEQEFRLQQQGYAAAIANPEVVRAIAAGVHGAIAVTFIEWAGPGEQTVIIPWSVIRDPASAQAIAEKFRTAPRAHYGRTAIGDAVEFSVNELAQSGIAAERRSSDSSGDGTNNSGRAIEEVRDQTVAKGITINALAIINERTGGVPGTFLYYHTHPPGGLPAYFRDNVIGGTGAFVLEVTNFDTFDESMIRKLLSEIADAHPARVPVP